MSEFSDGARPLAAATLGNMCGALTITTYSQSFFVGPVTAEFGWSPGQFFLGFTISAILGMIAGPWIGSLALKFNIRVIAMIGLVGHAIGYLLFSLNPDSLMLWYASWAAFTFLTAGSLPIIWTSILNGWFVENRGKAIGVTMAGSGIVAFGLPPVIEFLISNYGWRAAYQMTGATALLISFPVIFLWFREKTAVPVSEQASSPAGNSWGMTRKQAMRTAKFWNLAGVLFLTVFVVVGMLSNFGPIFGSFGVERETIATLAAIMGATVIFGRLLVGALVDRFWAPAVAVFFFSILAISLLLLINAPFSMTLAVGVSIAVGLAAGAELDLLAYLTSKYFGPRNYSEVFGGIFAIFALGGGISPAVFGEMAARTGSYTAPLYLGVAFLLVCLPLYLMLGSYPKAAIEEVQSR